jgi:hypothetical protein
VCSSLAFIDKPLVAAKAPYNNTASAKFLFDLQLASVRPSPHIFNNLPPPRLVVV